MLKEKPEEAKQLADEIIRNTYRTLMTCGQKGCFVYCTDKELEGYLIERVRDIQQSNEKNEFFRETPRVAEDQEDYKN